MDLIASIVRKPRTRAANDNRQRRRISLVQFEVSAPLSVEIEVFGAIWAELEAENDNERLDQVS